MRKFCVCKRCPNGGRLGLSTTSSLFNWDRKFFCSIRCREAYRSALYEEARRTKAVVPLLVKS
jgi:hypothetical protein